MQLVSGMTRKLILVAAVLGASLACQSPQADTPREKAADVSAAAQREAERDRAAINKRLDQLDSEVDRLDSKAENATGKAKAKLKEQARDMRTEARKLRDRMSTWDDKVESSWRTAKREVEQGLDKTEDAFKKLADDIKR